MRMVDIILKKRRSLALTDEEIAFFVRGCTDGSIPDYQSSALCMAICFTGMTDEECASLTRHMMHSGDTVDLSALPNTADKHSTGGVGDKTSLILAPTAACLGLSVAKMSGRGLGHTGGTIDKLESIPGFRTSLSPQQFMQQVKEIGVAIVGQTGNLAPADKKLYALRDVTATVDSIPLIASSIMSKKLAAGSETIVLDVKYGSGAFMKTPEDAVKLAETMVKIGRANGRNISALITDMDFPLGRNIGNSLEVIEAVRVLRGEEKGDLYDVSAELCANMLAGSKNIPLDDAREAVKEAISSGRAYTKFLEWVQAQGGDASVIEENRLPVGQYSLEIRAEQSGYLTHLDAEMVGHAACLLGAGRMTQDDCPDLSAGIVLQKGRDEAVQAGDVLAVLYTSDEAKLMSAADEFRRAATVSPGKTEKRFPLIYRTVR